MTKKQKMTMNEQMNRYFDDIAKSVKKNYDLLEKVRDQQKRFYRETLTDPDFNQCYN